jgi:hypothetical protein
MSFRKGYTKEEFITAISANKSIAGVCRQLGLVPIGGNYATVKRKLSELELDTSHWTGQGWSAAKRLKDWKDYTKASHFKPHLISVRGHRCESCFNPTWLDAPIALELHHIDGDRTNNAVDNLELLCPNCHAQTNSWRGRNKLPLPLG